ncbi:hypothetical protein UFOVP789_27 [uncultured Caudovirales phage]|uniref:Uncharacterized protein n=1 Tax=uncultured Caudovirales phage TaxID=2100421 RepID=A0A6J5NR34_9CAUD|nr:hypothetical protein UFOVP789_27 [uncultured Caudovirales phage]
MIIVEHNCSTNEIIEREATAEEITQKSIDEADALALESKIIAKAEAKEAAQAKLAALGLTVEDLQALGL